MLRHALLLLGVACMVGCLFSCGTSTVEREQQNETLDELVQVEGTVAGMPTQVKVTRRTIRRLASQAITDTTFKGPDIPWQEVGQAAIGGLTSTIPGLGGIAGLALAAFAWVKKRSAEKALTQTVSGLDDAREAMGDEAWKESVAPHLHKAQDADVRRKVTKTQASAGG